MTALLLVFSLLLLTAVLVSNLAHRTVVSTAALFLIGGFVLGEGSLGVIKIEPGDPLVAELAELALFSVLFTDGMRVGLPELRSAWRLPGRALVFGLPLTLAMTAVFGWGDRGAPVVGSAAVGRGVEPDRPGVRRCDRWSRGDSLSAAEPAQRRERPQRRPRPSRGGRAVGGHGVELGRLVLDQHRGPFRHRPRRRRALGRHPPRTHPLLLGRYRLRAAERPRHRVDRAGPGPAHPRQRLPGGVLRRRDGGDHEPRHPATPSTGSASCWPSC